MVHVRIASLISVLLLVGYAYQAGAIENPYGLFSGLWHSMAGLFSLIGRLLFGQAYIIGEPHTALWYYAGFVFFWTTVVIEGTLEGRRRLTP
jgi:hypothetical protein